MEVNIDGTGFDVVGLEEGEDPDPEEEKKLKALFKEPYPNTSFIDIRRKLRRQKESIGYAFLEVLRNVAGEIVGFRNVETHNVRMVKLDTPILVKKVVERDGKEVELQMWDRERRFAQRVALKTLVYYKEFGASRDVDRNDGKWGNPDDKASQISDQNKGTELLMFGVNPDVITPYFVPRWINQMPSVVGSRKAEEQNLQFLDSGGMPPAIIFVQGGTLAKDASDQLRLYLSGDNQNKYRAVVVEAQSSSGSMDSAGNVQVRVERFGAEKANDAMFMAYDERTEEHVRVGFRLPPLFLGKPNDYNFATAQTAYMVAEAQVFQPERDAFDEVINKTIVKAMGIKTAKIKSRPITLHDIDNQMSMLGIAKDLATRESLLDTINQKTGFDLQLAPEPQPDTVSGQYVPKPGAPGSQVTAGGRPMPQQPGQPQEQEQPLVRGGVQKPQFQTPANPKALNNPGAVKTPKTALELIELAQDYAAMKGLTKKRDISEEQSIALRETVAGLNAEETTAFNSLLATYTFGSDSPDLVAITSVIQ
jgi:PBSX family phage portal protein